MMKHDLLDDVSVLLLKHQYTVRTVTRICFDLVARKAGNVLLVKVIEDVNSVAGEVFVELHAISSAMEAVALVVAEKAGHPLQDGVMYTRAGVYLLTPVTLESCISSRFPFLFSTNAGLAAAVIGEKLREEREEAGLSLGALADKLGVSPGMVRRYEHEQAMVSSRNIEMLTGLFGEGIFKRIRIFEHQHTELPASHSPIGVKYEELGFSAVDAKKAPFDIVARKDSEIIMTEIGDKISPHLQVIAQLLGTDRLVIFDKKKPAEAPAMRKKEFLDFEDAEELIKFIKEFG